MRRGAFPIGHSPRFLTFLLGGQMATRRYKVSPGMTEFQVIEEAGAATNSNVVEVTVDLAATLITDGAESGAQRAIKKQEMIDCLQKIMNHILSYPSPSEQ